MAQPSPARLKRLLHECCHIVQREGPQYHDAVAVYLSEQAATLMEILWLGPRLAGYMNGIMWGYSMGANDLANAIAMGDDNLDLRVN